MIEAVWNLTTQKLLSDPEENSFTTVMGKENRRHLAEKKRVLRNLTAILSLSVMMLEDFQDRSL